MSDCARLSDRVVSVAAGHSDWTPEEAQHLQACPDCGAEWRLARAGAALGASLPAPDVDRIASAVRIRLAAESQVASFGRRGRVWRWGVALAATALLGLAISYGGRRPDSEARPAMTLLTELEDLSSTELETVLGELEAGGSSDDGSMGDLDEDELEQVLQNWES